MKIKSSIYLLESHQIHFFFYTRKYAIIAIFCPCARTLKKTHLYRDKTVAVINAEDIIIYLLISGIHHNGRYLFFEFRILIFKNYILFQGFPIIFFNDLYELFYCKAQGCLKWGRNRMVRALHHENIIYII